MMQTTETSELSLERRAILASGASAAYLDHFSEVDRRSVSGIFQSALVTRSRTYYSRGQAHTITWQDYGQPLPPWFDPLMQGFVDLLTLPPNWDTYGAEAIHPTLVDTAITFMNEVLGSNSPAPHVVPLSSGGLQLEWHRRGTDLEIVFDPGEAPLFFYRNRASGEEGDHNLPDESGRLRTIISALE